MDSWATFWNRCHFFNAKESVILVSTLWKIISLKWGIVNEKWSNGQCKAIESSLIPNFIIEAMHVPLQDNYYLQLISLYQNIIKTLKFLKRNLSIDCMLFWNNIPIKCRFQNSIRYIRVLSAEQILTFTLLQNGIKQVLPLFIVWDNSHDKPTIM